MPLPYRTTVLPSDGDWAAQEWFSTTALELAPPEVVEAALLVLRSIFTTDWAREAYQHELANGPGHAPHPFVLDYLQRGGIRSLLELGFALAYLDAPSQLTLDLTRPERYRSRSREIITAALFKFLGCELRFLPEKRGPKRPEFIASLDGVEVGVEVKGLDYGEAEKHHDRLWRKAHQVIPEAFHARCSAKDSTVHFELDDEVLDHIFGDESGHAAAESGREWGSAWARLVEAESTPGQYPGPPGVTLTIRPQGRNTGLQYSMNVGSPPTRKYWERMRRRLKKAAPKFTESGIPGIVVFEPPVRRGVWPRDVLHSLMSALRAKPTWATKIAAVILSESIPFIDRGGELEHGSDLRILHGPRWGELPPTFRQLWSSSCAQCGCVHDHFDLLTFLNRASTAEKPAPT